MKLDFDPDQGILLLPESAEEWKEVNNLCRKIEYYRSPERQGGAPFPTILEKLIPSDN